MEKESLPQLTSKNCSLDDFLGQSPYKLEKKDKDQLFLEWMNESFSYHVKNCPAFDKYVQRRGFDSSTVFTSIEEIPYLPVQAFKEHFKILQSVDSKEIKVHLQSSATSGVPSTVSVDKVTSRRQVKALASVISERLGGQRRPFLIFDVDPQGPQAKALGARGAAVRGFLNLASSAEYCMKVNDAGVIVLDSEKVLNTLKSLQESQQPVVVLGFTYVLYLYGIKKLLEDGSLFKLNPDSYVVHIGGWKKLEDQKVSKDLFNKNASNVFGMDTSNVVDFYGFTEQMGVTYPDLPTGEKCCPVFSEVIVRDPVTLKPVKDGEEGLLQFLTPLPNSYPGISVLTDDVGVILSRDGSNGFNGTKFRILGRAKKAEIRGCGDIMGDKVVRSEKQLTQQDNKDSVSPKLLFDGEIKVKNTYELKQFYKDLPDADINLICNKLRENRKILDKYSVDDLISLISKVAKTWMSPDSSLYFLRQSGLQFLVDWCSSNNLRKIVDEAMLGKRAHLDAPQASELTSRRMLFAQPRGLIVHWLAGNVPLLGMLSLVQAMLTRNANLLKAPSNFGNVMPLILQTFNEVEVKASNGKILRGTDLMKTVSVIYYSRDQIGSAEILSSQADIRLAWGGRESVESVMNLPRRYGTEDIVFGPKLSYMAIGKEMLNEERIAKKFARGAAVDSSVFDQYACASPHTIFVEKGGKFASPELFAKLLSEQMNKVSLRIPKEPIDASAMSKIISKRLEYEFKGNLWTSEGTEWTVLYDENGESGLVDPCYSRVITVRAVDDIMKTSSFSHSGIQTIGLGLNSDRKQAYAIKASSLGAERFPDVGHMTEFDSPWDGVFPIERMIKWVSIGGPFRIR